MHSIIKVQNVFLSVSRIASTTFSIVLELSRILPTNNFNIEKQNSNVKTMLLDTPNTGFYTLLSNFVFFFFLVKYFSSRCAAERLFFILLVVS